MFSCWPQPRNVRGPRLLLLKRPYRVGHNLRNWACVSPQPAWVQAACMKAMGVHIPRSGQSAVQTAAPAETGSLQTHSLLGSKGERHTRRAQLTARAPSSTCHVEIEVPAPFSTRAAQRRAARHTRVLGAGLAHQRAHGFPELRWGPGRAQPRLTWHGMLGTALWHWEQTHKARV